MGDRRIGRILATVVVVGVLIGACSSGGATGTPVVASPTPASPVETASASPAASTATSFAGTTLTLWRKDYDNAGIDNMNTAFEAQTGAKIEVTKIPYPGTDNVLPKWTAGERPDVLFLEGFASTMAKLNAKENLQPLDRMAFAQNTAPGLKDFGVLDGVRYWAPLTAPSVNGLLYNKQVLTELGLTLPTTYQELLGFCDQAKAKSKTPMVIGMKSNFPAWITVNAMTSDFVVDNPEFSAGLMSRTTKFTDPEYVKRIQSLVDLKDRGCYQDQAEAVDFSESMKVFMDGDAAIFNCASFCIPDLLGAYGIDAVNEKVGFMPISYSKPAVWVFGADDWGAYLPKSGDATREAAAKAYVDFITGDGYVLYLEAQLENSRYPNHPVPDPSKVATPMKDAYASAQSLPAAVGFEPLLVCFPSYADYYTSLTEMYVGDKTANQVAESLQASFDQTCQDLNMPGF